MPNTTVVLTIDEVHTPADRVFYLCQECGPVGLLATFGTMIGSIVGIPLMLKACHRYVPMPHEYKFASGAILSVALSYYAGVHAKKRCEEDLKKQLDEKLNAET